ncbi:uracil-DNA glycosylase [Haloarcula nitratireducens]|uniref:Uracil-DNA glycosylase n=1 Tax=Haloarcula nitratireducens TaxID=2487749 RepID=A0AAW4P9V3_9EURY|nr:uracil-DNA glycosylase [Halomicroarcula nitratireducens]MBX0294445.1 uracil-DNA glycosylase [Halomicroarcula nitratireducens]
MEANQETIANPFGMDETCQNCPELCETRENVVHGYGDVGAEFVVLGDSPSEGADESGIPFTGERERELLDILAAVDMIEDPDAAEPEMKNAFLTYVTRCRHPERPATEEEVMNCEPYLNGEIRMINPELLLPVGQRPLEELAFEYTTLSEDELDVEERHATTIRGRGFEILPMIPPAEQTDEERTAFLEHFSDVLGQDYRQTKGRRGR